MEQQQFEQCEHPGRVAWYHALIEEWTAQAPHVAILGEMVAAWVNPYMSSYGVRHSIPTQVWAASVEKALEGLCTQVYEDVRADYQVMVVGRQVSRV